MKALRSSIFQKMIAGYRIVHGFEGGYPYPEASASSMFKPLNFSELSETFKVPAPTLEQIYHKTKQIIKESKRPEGIDLNDLKNKVENLENTTTSSGAYIIPQISSLISSAKERIRDLELAASPQDATSQVKRQLEDLELEKKTLEEAKEAVMQKYYNREIDESSIKNIMDDYEKRLTETDIKIRNLKEGRLPEKSSAQPKEAKLLTVAGASAFPSRMPQSKFDITLQPNIKLKFAKMFRPPPLTVPTASGYPGYQAFPSGSGMTPVQGMVSTQPLQQSITTSKIEINKISKEVQGYEIPQITKGALEVPLEPEEKRPYVSLAYPLIPRSPEKNQPVFAYAKIYWDVPNNRYVYDLVEPDLTEKLTDMYKKTKEMLEQRLDVDFSKLKKIEAKDFLNKQVDEVLKFFKLELAENEKKILKYYIERDFTGLELLEPFLQDANIEDISCDGVGIPLFVFHRNPDVGSIITNVKFDTSEQLDSFIIRLAQLCGKSISVSNPLLDGTLPDGSRIQVTLGTDIARRGSNFTIRKFTEEPLTPVNLINYGTVDTNILAYLWFIVDYGRSILVSGGTASGKTSLLNVLSLFIRPEKKIVSIEDTAELRLPHPHWVPVVARTAIGIEGKNEVDMFELLRESLRQRPDYIIVGEVRGKEAYILFQQMATGHPSLATIHAENTAKLVDRLTTPPISLPAGLISSLDLVIFLARLKYKGRFVRKIIEVVEIVGFDPESNTPVINQIYKWNPQKDEFQVTNKSISLKKISDFTGVSEKDIKNEIQRRIVVLNWMKENNILDYRNVHRIFSIYYTDPERVISYIQGAG